MPDIIQSLKYDARFVLETKEFWLFLQQLIKQCRLSSYYNIPIFSENLNDWLICQLEDEISLSKYSFFKKKGLYSDEAYYTLIGYSLVVKLNNVEQEIEVSLEQLYDEPDRYSSYSIPDQYHQIIDELDSYFEPVNLNSSQREKLMREISCLICYATSLFQKFQ